MALFPAWATKEPDKKQGLVNDITFNTAGELSNPNNALLNAMTDVLPVGQIRYNRELGRFTGTRIDKIV